MQVWLVLTIKIIFTGHLLPSVFSGAHSTVCSHQLLNYLPSYVTSRSNIIPINTTVTCSILSGTQGKKLKTCFCFQSMFRPNNMIAQSQSGTGKTAAFVLSMLSRIDATKIFTQVKFQNYLIMIIIIILQLLTQ